MKILVCGSEGRIMSYTIPRLLSFGHQVIGVDNGQKWGKNQENREYVRVWGDCVSSDFLLPLLNGVDCVIQAAATLYGVVGMHKYPADILRDDLLVQQNVLDCSLKAGVSRFVYISSSMVYDRSNHCSEDGDELTVPMTDYGLSKLVCERLLRAYARQYGMEFTIFRPFNALDPDEKHGDEVGISHVVPDLLHKLIVKQQQPLEILGDGNQVRCFCHIREIAEAIADFSFDARTKNGTYNIGRREPISIKELAKKIYQRAYFSNDCNLEFNYLPVPSTDVRERIGDFTKIKNTVGWEANIPLDKILDECITQLQTRILMVSCR